MTEPILVPLPESLLVETEVKVPNCYPLDPGRQAITDAALRRTDGGWAPLFVSWCRPDGARFAATIIGGAKNAEKFASAVRRFENPLIVRIGRFAYEGLPPKIQGYVPRTFLQPTEDEARIAAEAAKEAARKLILPDTLAEGTSPEAPISAEAPSAIERT